MRERERLKRHLLEYWLFFVRVRVCGTNNDMRSAVKNKTRILLAGIGKNEPQEEEKKKKRDGRWWRVKNKVRKR